MLRESAVNLPYRLVSQPNFSFLQHLFLGQKVPILDGCSTATASWTSMLVPFLECG